MAFEAGSITGGLQFDVSEFTAAISGAQGQAQGFGGAVAASIDGPLRDAQGRFVAAANAAQGLGSALRSGAEAPMEHAGGTFARVSQQIAHALHFPTGGFAGSMLEVESITKLFPPLVIEFLENPLLAFVALAKEAMAKVGEAIEGVAERFHKIGVESLKSGLDPQTFSTYAAAAKSAGVDIQEFSNGLKFMQDRAANALRGDASGAKAFTDLGISARELTRLLEDPKAMLLRVADAISAIPNPALRVQASMELMSRAGTDLLPFLTKGSAGIQSMADEMGRLGGGVNESQVKIGEGWTEMEAKFSAIWDGMKVKLAQPILEALQGHMAEIMPAVEHIASMLSDGIGGALSAILPMGLSLFGLVESLFDVLKPIVDLIVTVLVPVLQTIMAIIKPLIDFVSMGLDGAASFFNTILHGADSPQAQASYQSADRAFGRLAGDFGFNVGPVEIKMDTNEASTQVAAKLHPEIAKGYDQLRRQYNAAATTHKVTRGLGGRR